MDIKVANCEKEEYVRLYNSGWSTVKIGKRFNKTPRSINYYLKKMGVKLRSNRVNSRKYYINNESYFSVIDTEAKAYLLGFIYADGYITQQKSSKGSEYTLKRLGLSILSQDKEILELLKRELDTNYNIYNYKTNNGYSENTKYSRLLINSNRLVEDLEQQGVFFNKTNILKPPVDLRKEYIRHFIRGYIDGDGSIIKSRSRDKIEFSINVVGTDDMLNWIGNYFVENKLLVRDEFLLEKRKKHQQVSYCRWGGNSQVKRILDHLYKNATYFLNRKHERYLEL